VAAYQNNPTLLAKRSQVAATGESVSQALSNWRPSLTIDGDITRTRIETPVGNIQGTPYSGGATLSQAIFRGGQTIAETTRTDNETKAALATLMDTEQQVFVDVAAAYMNALRQQTLVEARRNNMEALDGRLQETRAQFKVGAATKTDTAQANARYLEAKARLTETKAALEVAKSQLTNLTGLTFEEIAVPALSMNPSYSREVVMSAGETLHPDVQSAEYLYLAADASIDEEAGTMLPQVYLDANADYNRDSFSFASAGQDSDIYSLTARLSMELYQGGAALSRVRAAKHTRSMRRADIQQARLSARQAALSAWTTYQAATEKMVAYETQIEAAELALEGTRKEFTVGARTTLDILDAQQEVLDAQENFINAQYDVVVSQFEVMAAAGQLTADHLQLETPTYNANAVYQDARGKWFGVGE